MNSQAIIAPAGIRSLALTALTASFLLMGGRVTANAQTLNFVPNAPLYTENYNGLVIDAAITSIGWTNSLPAGVTEYSVFGAAPSGTAYPANPTPGQPTVVVKNTKAGRNNLSSPVFTQPDLGASSVVYASGWFYQSSQSLSGGRVLLRRLEGGNVSYVGGFGILDTGANRGAFSLFGSSWSYSAEKALANHWYEIALVVQLDESDVSLSKGYLYVRDATNGDTDFRLIEDLAGIAMGYSTTHQFDNFNSWRVEGFQGGAEIGALSLGTGVLQPVPEPGAVSLVLLSGLAIGGLRFYHQKRSH